MYGDPRLTYYNRGFYTSTGWRVVHYPLSALDTSVQPTLEEAAQFNRSFGLSKPGEDDDEYDDDDNEMGLGSGGRSGRKGVNGGAIGAIAATMGGVSSGGNSGPKLVEGDVVS
jgi:hypothetical protein